MEKPGEQQNLNEPSTTYRKKVQVSVSHSFEEMNEFTAKVMSELSPEEHLRNVTTLLKKMYAEQLAKPMKRRLTFDQ